MSRITSAALLLCGLLMVAGCSKSSSETSAGPAGFHKAAQEVAEAPGNAMASAIQEKKLPEYPESRVGEAFNAYRFFEKREWRERKAADGKYYVDFVGWLKPGAFDASAGADGRSVKGVEVKFVIYQDGRFYVAMISRIESGADGRLSAFPLADTKPVMDALYQNKKMRL